jgi:hypothetical protein
MQVYVENDFVTGEPTFVVIIPGEFVANRLSSISSGRASSSEATDLKMIAKCKQL